MIKKLIFLSFLFLAGCHSESFYKAGDGVLLSAGLSLPSEETVQIEALNYTSGERVYVRHPSYVRHKSEFSATNTYLFGLIEIRETRRLWVSAYPTNHMNLVERIDR